MFGSGKPGQEKADKLKETIRWVDDFVKGGKFAAGTSDLTIGDLSLLATYATLKACAVPGVDLSEFKNAEAWYEKCIKIVPNYEKACGEGANNLGAFYKSKLAA